MNVLYLAGQVAKTAGHLPENPKSADDYYAEYAPTNLRQFMPIISAVSAVGVWLVLLGLIPR